MARASGLDYEAVAGLAHPVHREVNLGVDAYQALASGLRIDWW